MRYAIGIASILAYVCLVSFVLIRRLLEPTPELLAASVAPFGVLVAVSTYACGWCTCCGKKDTTADGYRTMELATVYKKAGYLDRFR
jgi:cytochrome bd-type quinol oxidase subunit 1